MKLKDFKKDILHESTNSKKLKDKFMAVIDEVDENLSYKDLAETVALILKDEYGEHNFEVFISELEKKLKS